MPSLNFQLAEVKIIFDDELCLVRNGVSKEEAEDKASGEVRQNAGGNYLRDY